VHAFYLCNLQIELQGRFGAFVSAPQNRVSRRRRLASCFRSREPTFLFYEDADVLVLNKPVAHKDQPRLRHRRRSGGLIGSEDALSFRSAPRHVARQANKPRCGWCRSCITTARRLCSRRCGMRTASARGLSLGFQQNRAHFPTFPPCVAFNNHAGSTKSFDYVREHNGGFCAISTMTQTS
jgi:hypothetical protein